MNKIIDLLERKKNNALTEEEIRSIVLSFDYDDLKTFVVDTLIQYRKRITTLEELFFILIWLLGDDLYRKKLTTDELLQLANELNIPVDGTGVVMQLDLKKWMAFIARFDMEEDT